MRNLIAFLRRFQICLVFALLQVISLVIYVQFLSFPRSQYLTTASNVTAKVLTWENDITKHFDLSKNNWALQRENIRLRERLPEFMYTLSATKVKVQDTVFEQQYTYIPGEVINSSVTRKNNYFTLNIGSKHGVKRDMGVFSDNGVVGIVHNVSEHYCVVKSVLTEDINIDVIIEPIHIAGILKWDGHDPRRGSIDGVSNDLRIKKWSKVVTRGGSGIFPKGIPVGKVESIEPIEGESLWNVVIRYSEDYRRLQRVYVVKNLLIEEQKELEGLIPPDKEEDLLQ
jgi:rod shape-determining protein MreC